MKRTNNGILIPDVPIMAGGNLPNAVKGVGAGNSNAKWRSTGGYIQGDGQAYINTLINVKSDLSVSLKFTRSTKNERQCVFGTIGNASPFINGLIDVRYASQRGKFDIYWNGKIVIENRNYNPVPDGEAVLRFEITEGRILYCTDDGSSIYVNEEIGYTEYSKNLELYLWKGFDANAGDHKIYYFIIKSASGELLREMYPAIDTDGVACMYDYVSSSFFYNNGDGSFTVSDSVRGA